MLLADLGARVIKVEQTGQGDPFRSFKGELYSPHFQTYNRNKQSIELDTRLPEDLLVLDKLVAEADVFIQNFRPGVASRLGVDAPRLQGLNPRLVYASISGFGPEGPDRDRPAFDTVAQAASGFLRLLVNPAHPRVVGPAIADALTGFYAAYGILAALHERERTGKGRLVETSMFESMAHFNLDDFTHYFSEGLVMDPPSRPHVSQSYVFECHDHKWIALTCPHRPNSGKISRRPSAGRTCSTCHSSRRAMRASRITSISSPSSRRSSRRSRAISGGAELQALEVPHSPVRTSVEVVESAQAQALGMIIEDPGRAPRALAHGPFAGQLRWRTDD